ncbi:MAG: hypothetical protein Q8R51_09465 [Azonexus sp.]|nr:hypothetical protein [Azonexus sp.]MDP3637600.1 hypothetical protein [Azonexus sp.]
MSYRVRFTQDVEADPLRLYECILTKDQTDWSLASQALEAIKNGIRSLELSPFSYRKASPANPFLRKLFIPFGASGCVAFSQDRQRPDSDYSGGTATAGRGLPMRLWPMDQAGKQLGYADHEQTFSRDLHRAA